MHAARLLAFVMFPAQKLFPGLEWTSWHQKKSEEATVGHNKSSKSVLEKIQRKVNGFQVPGVQNEAQRPQRHQRQQIWMLIFSVLLVQERLNPCHGVWCFPSSTAPLGMNGRKMTVTTSVTSIVLFFPTSAFFCFPNAHFVQIIFPATEDAGYFVCSWLVGWSM